MLRELEAAGLQLVIITNGHHHIQRAKLLHCAAADVFSNILVGGEEVGISPIIKSSHLCYGYPLLQPLSNPYNMNIYTESLAPQSRQIRESQEMV